jgi:hypothetical protein
MSFPLELVVIDADPRVIRDIHVRVSALGDTHELQLAPQGHHVLAGRLTLPDAPRFLRIEADCTTSSPSHPCLDEVHFLSSTDAELLELQLVTHDGQGELMIADSTGLPLWQGFSWGAVLLAVTLFGVLRSRDHA